MGTFESTIEIRRPLEEVFAYLANTENETDWQSGLIESKFTSGDIMGPGATGRDVRRSMGLKVVNEWEVTEFTRNRSFAFKVTKPLSFSGVYTFAGDEEKTRVSMSASPLGFTRYIWPLIARMGRKQYAKDFGKLKEVLEAGAPTQP